MNFKAILLCLLLLLPGPALAGQITLAWDYDVALEAGTSGFKLYWKDSPGGAYTNYVTVGKTFRQTVITGLTDGQTYYFVATAYSATGATGPQGPQGPAGQDGDASGAVTAHEAAPDPHAGYLKDDGARLLPADYAPSDSRQVIHKGYADALSKWEVSIPLVAKNFTF